MPHHQVEAWIKTCKCLRSITEYLFLFIGKLFVISFRQATYINDYSIAKIWTTINLQACLTKPVNQYTSCYCFKAVCSLISTERYLPNVSGLAIPKSCKLTVNQSIILSIFSWSVKFGLLILRSSCLHSRNNWHFVNIDWKDPLRTKITCNDSFRCL